MPGLFQAYGRRAKKIGDLPEVAMYDSLTQIQRNADCEGDPLIRF
jgi:hypothetical protein